MKKSLALLLLLAACDRSEPAADQGNGAAPAAAGQEARPAAAAAQGRLTGLYEGGAGAQKNQLCMVEKGGRGPVRADRLGRQPPQLLGRRAGGAQRRAADPQHDRGRDLHDRSDPEGRHRRPAGDAPDRLRLLLRRPGAAWRAPPSPATGDDAKKATDIAGDPLCD